MAYRLKTVRYQQFDRRVLLQNENGPCPLLAAANVLLLQGKIRLPSNCVGAGVATLDDVVNVLGEYALQRRQERRRNTTTTTKTLTTTTTTTTTTSPQPPPSPQQQQDDDDDDEQEMFHLNEWMQILPSLQYGMDVNPQFTSGVYGVEYTPQLTAFDVLGVELVHGWLLDPQDAETHAVVGTKTYNELVELVIQGTDASQQLDDLHAQMRQLQQEETTTATTTTTENNPPSETSKDDQATTTTTTTTTTTAAAEGGGGEEKKTEEVSSKPVAPPQDSSLQDLKQRIEEASVKATNGVLIQTFLESTSHQLTYFGLMELYKRVKEDGLVVFFRNNHFGTLTKHGGLLYLLVTDLGYATASEIVWEKLDAIDGGTEYCNPQFQQPPKPTHTAAGHNLSPEQADLQLALSLSSRQPQPQQPQGATTTTNGAAAAATATTSGTIVRLPPAEGQTTEEADSKSTVAGQDQPPHDQQPMSYGSLEQKKQHDADLMMAMQIQAMEEAPAAAAAPPAPAAQLDGYYAEDSSLALAQHLQAEEYQRVRQTRNDAKKKANAAAATSGCVVS